MIAELSCCAIVLYFNFFFFFKSFLEIVSQNASLVIIKFHQGGLFEGRAGLEEGETFVMLVAPSCGEFLNTHSDRRNYLKCF